MRRLRAGLVTPHPGGPGPDRGALRPLREELAGLGLASMPRPRKRGPGVCISGLGRRCEPRWSAERRAPVVNGCPRRKAWRLEKDAPLGAPSPRFFRGAEETPRKAGQVLRPPRGRSKTRANSLAWMKLGCLKIESVGAGEGDCAISPLPLPRPKAHPSQPDLRPWAFSRAPPARLRSRQNGARIWRWCRAKYLPDRPANGGRG
jgi:hypothetical protein